MKPFIQMTLVLTLILRFKADLEDGYISSFMPKS